MRSGTLRFPLLPRPYASDFHGSLCKTVVIMLEKVATLFFCDVGRVTKRATLNEYVWSETTLYWGVTL